MRHSQLMKSIRLDTALEKRLREAARISHLPESLTIRERFRKAKSAS